MYVKIDQTNYTTLRNLSYSPQVDMIGDTVPINEFSVDIVTDDAITTGQYAELYDDLDNLWARYWIDYAELSGDDAVHIRAQSDISVLDGVTLDAVMYSGAAIGDVLDGIMVRQSGASSVTAAIDYSLSSAFEGVTITGYCPEQSARERLQWVSFAIGAFVRDCFSAEIEIEPIGSTVVPVPVGLTYGEPAPTVNHSDYVTALKITGYAFSTGTPTTDDETVTVGGTTYIVTETVYTLTNTAAPSTANDNVKEIDGVYLVNADNVSAILTHAAGYYFKRTALELEAVDNADYIPGDRVSVYATEQRMYEGFLEGCEFSFGLQAKAKLSVTAADALETAPLTILYKWGSMQLDKRVYYFPVLYEYSLDNPYIDGTWSGHQYVFRPLTASVSGTLPAGGATVTVQYEVALDLHKGVLHVISVDEVTVDSSGDDAIGVIA